MSVLFREKYNFIAKKHSFFKKATARKLN